MDLTNHYTTDLSSTRRGIQLRRAIDTFLQHPDLETREMVYEALSEFYTFHGKQLHEDFW